MTSGVAPLSDLRVIDLSSGIAGAYCTKLLADAGADVVKVEAPDGDPLRRWSASGAAIADGDDGALFSHLAASKRSVVVEPGPRLDALHEWLRVADVVVWSRGSTVAEAPACSPADLIAAHPHLVIASITPFGLDGPWSDRPATEFTLQAWSGGIIGLGRGAPDRAPIHVGGQIGEWLTGVYTAAATLAALRRGTDHGDRAGEIIDVSMLEVMASCLTYHPVTFQQQLGYPMRRKRFVPTPGVAAASDGLVGLGCGTGQQWLDFCVMAGHPEWMEERSYFLDRTALAPTIDAWVAGHTVAEVTDLASAFRIPNAPIVDGANASEIEHFVERHVFVENPRDGVRNPGPPYRLSSAVLPPRRPAPALGKHTDDVPIERAPRADPAATRGLPFEGLRVLDMTAFWAGPLVGHVLALLGAEVIHVESAKRPDGVRLVGGVPQTEPQYWERGPIFSALNTNKKSLTIDFADPRGVDLVKRVAATCDVVVENYTPRVLDGAGLDYESLRAVNPDLVMVRMPGFGLDGPWRDLAAFAFVIEDASGLTWLTGHPDLLPNEPYGVGDPNAGLHALVGLLVALRHRDRTGEGSLVEAAMVDAALNIAAEQVIEHSAYGALLTRTGNRGPCAAPQNLYQAAAPPVGRDDVWVAIAVADDEQWVALCAALGHPSWAADPALAIATGRVAAHDAIDEHLAAWCRERPVDEIVDTLWSAGVPVGKVIQPHEQPDLEQLQHRGFFEELDHPVIGPSRYAALPFRSSAGPDRYHRRAAPLLGEHNDELLGDLGLTAAEIESLEADGIIGRSIPSG